MAGKGIDGIGIVLVGAGSVLMYGGIKGYSPLKVLQNVISGKPMFTNVGPDTLLTVPDYNAPQGPPAPGPPNLSSNQALGQTLATDYGWGSGSQWTSLVQLWNRESSWNNRAKNPSSGAYGIPQALPYTKMPKAAWPESAGGQSDAATQIKWGLAYIKGRYGTPVAAWAHSQQKGWY